MVFLISEDPSNAAKSAEALFGGRGGTSPVTIPDEEMRRLPFFDVMLDAISRAQGVLAAIVAARPLPTSLVVAVVYGDGAAPQMRVVDVDGRTTVAVVVDLRIAIECLAHLAGSPLGRYAPSVEVSAAIEKLAVATRVAAMRDRTFAHLALGILAEAQDVIHGDGAPRDPIGLGHFLASSFLSQRQLSMIVRTAVSFQVFHEFGHFLCRHDPDRRANLEHNLSSYVRVQADKAMHDTQHDEENRKLVRQIFGSDFDLILTKETSAVERGRLLEARLLARQDKEELLCDNFAVQSTAKVLVDDEGLGSPDWLLVRYTMEYLLASAWGVLASRPIFSLACKTWNLEASGELTEQDRDQATSKLEALIAERRANVLVQRFRLRYALEQFDAIMAILIHGALKSGIPIRPAVDLVFPSPALARILHEFSARHTNLIDRSLYTIDGLARCSSRGRALVTLQTPGASRAEAPVGDVFAFYLLGRGYHLAGL